MKITNFLFISLLALAASPSAKATDCADAAEIFFLSYTTRNNAEAAQQAADYCSQGGNAPCLAKAQKWFFKNTKDTGQQAGLNAANFCSADGSLACAETKRLTFVNDPNADRDQSARLAAEACTTISGDEVDHGRERDGARGTGQRNTIRNRARKH